EFPLPEDRTYPARPFLAVSAAIVRDGHVLVVQRARPPAGGMWSLPGGVVETGETLIEAVQREARGGTSNEIEPVALAGYRESITPDGTGRVERHFVILPFAARWVSGEPRLNDELSEARWVRPSELAPLPTTPGLALIVARAFELLEAAAG